jgi:PAS domain S-box-containing protein
MKERLRKSGIDIIGDVPWGTHFCQFFQTKEDLIDILIPYFKAGLENNEFCMWITAEPLLEDEAKNALQKAIPDIDRHLKQGQIEIIPYNDWYTKGGSFDSDRVLNGWVNKLNNALEKGFDGLRLSGNTFWLEKEDWNDFIDYEEEIDSVISRYKMMALCTYSLEKCTAAEIIDVVNNHEFALTKHEGKWELIESSENKQIKEAAIRAQKDWEQTFNAVPDLIVLLDDDHKVIRANKSMAETLGLTPEECIGLECYRVVHGTDEPPSFCPHSKLLEDGCEHIAEVHEDILGGYFIVSTSPFYDTTGKLTGSVHVARNITERKYAETEKEELLKELQQFAEELEASNEELRATTEELHVANEELMKARAHLEEKVKERTKEVYNERQRLFDVLETLPLMICLLTPD